MLHCTSAFPPLVNIVLWGMSLILEVLQSRGCLNSRNRQKTRTLTTQAKGTWLKASVFRWATEVFGQRFCQDNCPVHSHAWGVRHRRSVGQQFFGLYWRWIAGAEWVGVLKDQVRELLFMDMKGPSSLWRFANFFRVHPAGAGWEFFVGFVHSGTCAP